MANKRLGKGLRALIPDVPPEDTTARVNSIQEIEVRKIRPNPFQPRGNFDEVALSELRNSIAEKGIIQPITVRRKDDGYELISGERRLRAVSQLEVERIPAYVLEVESDEEMLELSLIENIQREDLNPIDVARAYQTLLTQCNLTQEQVSRRVGKERSTVANFLRLLKLPEPIQQSLVRGEINMGHGRALLAIEDKTLQMGIWEKAVKNKLSVREVERLTKKSIRSEKKTTSEDQEKNKPYFIVEAEDRLRSSLSTQVRIKHGKKGGRIEIEYYSDDELERILEMFE
ncbi:MAG: ParB/RepB/Spo0J family partition protein [Calditrichaeota bacterium]|nr:ParB/RepB/Spo0J family partition protein [Calditrichota bacterium]